MIVRINKSIAKGHVDAPSSKSMAHRLLICASLANGKSEISSLAFSEDIKATIECMQVLGSEFKFEDDKAIISGINGKIQASGDFQCQESGSTLRFIIPMLMLADEKNNLTGYGRLMQRPMKVYEDIAATNNVLYEKNDDVITVGGGLKSGTFTLRGDISSQFISGLLFALPLLSGDSMIEILPPVESRSYIDMTISAMKTFGVDVVWQTQTSLYIKGNQKYKPCKMRVEGDYSNAAFLDFFNYFDGSVEVGNLKQDSLQGDSIYKEYFQKLNNGYAELDVSNCPDLAPILMSFASAKHGCKLTGTRRLKIKESDRGVVMADELSKFGCKIEVKEDEIEIYKNESLHAPTQMLLGHNDHRVVMSLVCLCSKFGGEVDEAQAVSKSFPDFFEYMQKLGIEVISRD